MDIDQVREILAKVEFAPEEIIMHGWETVVYRRKRIPFVVKTPQEGHDFRRTKKRYDLSASGMGETAAEFSLVSDIELKGARPYSGEAFIQVIGEPLDELLLTQGRDEDKLAAVRGLATAEHTAMRRGRILYANFLKNSIFRYGGTQVVDLGHTLEDYDKDLPDACDPFHWPGSKIGTEQVMNKRGFVIYTNADSLRKLGREDLRDAYVEAMGLELKDNVVIGVTAKDLIDHMTLVYSFITRMYDMPEYKAHMDYYGPGDYFRDLNSHVTAVMALVNGIPGKFEGLPRLTNELINLVTRNKYDSELQYIAMQEHEKFFGKEEPVAMKPFLS